MRSCMPGLQDHCINIAQAQHNTHATLRLNSVCTYSVLKSHCKVARSCFRMPNDRLPKKLLFGEVKGLCPPGRPRSSFNDVALHCA